MASMTSARALAPLGTAGKLFAFALDVARQLPRRPFQLREFIQQAWFIASVTIVPTALVAIPFGAVIALQVGGLIKGRKCCPQTPRAEWSARPWSRSSAGGPIRP